MHLRLAPAAHTQYSGDGVHKAPSPFCKAEMKRYMLCPHAYAIVDSRVTCRSGVRRPDRVEVGRRQGRYSLQRSASPRCAACGDINRLSRRFHQQYTFSFLIFEFAAARPSGVELSQLRNSETRRPGHHSKHRRCGRCAIGLRARIAARSHGLSLSRWSSRAGLSADGSRVRIARRAARAALVASNHSRRSWNEVAGDGASSFHRPTRIRCSAACRPSTSFAAEDAWPTSRQQSSDFATELRCAERRAPSNRSAHEQACSSVAPCRFLKPHVRVLASSKHLLAPQSRGAKS